jgi:hypothetical protein
VTTGNKVALTLAGACIALLAMQRYQSAERDIRVYYEVAAPEVTHAPIVVKHTTSHPVYSYSLIPGGVENVDDFCEQIQFDEAFAGFDCSKAHEIATPRDMHVFMTFRKNGHVRWTRKPVLVKGGERVYTDGTRSFLARCANQISFVPMQPSMDIDHAQLETPAAVITPVSESVPALPPVRESATPIASVSQASSSGSKWGAFAAVPVLIWHGGSHTATNEPPVVIAPKPSCDPIETHCD